MIDAAFSADIKKGILKLFILVAGVFTKPGLISFIFTSFGKSTLKDSQRLIKAALVGPYKMDFGRPL